MVATTIVVNKPSVLLPTVKQPPVDKSAKDNEKTSNENDWLESRIHLNDLHQHYLKLSKSRLTSKCI